PHSHIPQIKRLGAALPPGSGLRDRGSGLGKLVCQCRGKDVGRRQREDRGKTEGRQREDREETEKRQRRHREDTEKTQRRDREETEKRHRDSDCIRLCPPVKPSVFTLTAPALDRKTHVPRKMHQSSPATYSAAPKMDDPGWCYLSKELPLEVRDMNYGMFYRGDYHIDVCINDYLDVFCPHYLDYVPEERMERYVLYMVNYDGYSSCDHTAKGFKRWESSTVADNGRRSCLRLKVFVRPANNCVKTVSVHDRVFDVNERVDNSLEPRDDTSHESAEPSRGDVNSVGRVQTTGLLVTSALVLWAAILPL
ncbi:unnamed protein product, partial [Coregonus sp. 'balchen']